MQAADRVENYSGGIDFDLFMDAIELIAEQNQWTELVTVQVIESKLRGRAKEYYLALKANERPKTCQQMRNWLREIFSKTPNKEEAKRELQRCMRDADESLGAYAHRLKMIANRIFPEDDLSAAQIFHRDRMVVESFLQGIDLRLANEILRAGEFYKINDILPIAQHYENIISRQLEENSFENFRTAIRAVTSAPIPSNAKQSFRARNNKPYFNANHNQRQEGNGQQVNSHSKFITLQIHTQNSLWLIDSEASVSIVKNSFVQKFKIPTTRKNEIAMTDISGNMLRKYGEANITFELAKNIKISHEFIICGSDLNFDADGLLGLDFFEKFQPRLDFKEEVLELKGVRLPLESARSSQHHVVAYNSNNRAALSEGLHRNNKRISNNPKEPADLLVINSLHLQRAGELKDLANPDICRGFDHTRKYPNLVSIKEDLEIPPFHGCDYWIPINNRIPAGTVICKPSNTSQPGICIARSVTNVPPTTQNDPNHRKIVIRILNTTPTPLTIQRHTPILNVTPVSGAFEGTGPNLRCNEELRPFMVEHLQEYEREKLYYVLEEYPDLFAVGTAQLNVTNLVKHRINTDDSPPIAKPPYRVPFARKQVRQNCIQEMLDNVIIRRIREAPTTTGSTPRPAWRGRRGGNCILKDGAREPQNNQEQGQHKRRHRSSNADEDQQTQKSGRLCDSKSHSYQVLSSFQQINIF
ncbi:hypothetical protein TcasGA2_TC033503 [Tribolium castaneum]|uniref:Retrotransposon gag domain-containing protein n=1 Tax=Tribolium castaneum TaxID=7070 RepID=A0A139W8Z0_TRICA|nr:hypothetical protein TcasGA2_TC033503 [Tribolium castaneum]